MKCRLCNNSSLFCFDLFVLRKYKVGYYKCSKCESLQTEPPYWLDEAYHVSNISYLDTGILQRNIKNFAITYTLTKIFGIKDITDIGGGNGLLCRLLRDYNLNCYSTDKYTSPLYNQGYQIPNFTVPDLLVAYEVLEHYSNPSLDLDEIFNSKANFIAITTSIYSRQDNMWWYLTPSTGQHVFFYSLKGLNYIANKYKYNFIVIDNLIIFYKKANIFKIILCKLLLNRYVIRVIRGLILIMPSTGVVKDYEYQVNVKK